MCDSPGEPLPGAKVVNLGEPGAPMNGATWMHSGQLSLADKLATDFAPTFRAPILGGDTGLDALIAAGRAAADALSSTGEAAATAAEATRLAVSTAIRRTVKGIAWFLRFR